jgi:hypothetical protein
MPQHILVRGHPGLTLALLLSLTFSMLGCDSAREAPPDVTVVASNAAPSFSTVAFLRVERAEASLSYRQFGRFRFDAHEYKFHLETLRLDGTAGREFSMTREIDESNDYIFVFNERTGDLAIDVFEFPVLATGSATSQYVVLHTAATLGPVDVFLAAPGADLATVAPIASLARGEQLPMQSVTGGTYEFSLTAQGDPTTVLMRSSSVVVASGLNLAFLLVDPDGLESTSALVVSSAGTSVALLDQNVQSSMRVINAVADRNGIDVLIDAVTTPLITNLAYGAPSPDFPIAPGNREITVTPTGNAGVTLVDEQALTFTIASRYLLLVHGESGSVFAYPSLDSRRPLPDRAQIRYINGTSDFSPLDFALTRTAFDRRALLVPADPLRNFDFPPDDYQLTVRNPSSDAVLAGPIPVTLAAGGVYSVLATDHATNSNQVELTLFDDFN